MTQSAVVRHLDRRATGLCLGPGHALWEALIARAMTCHAILTRRFQEMAPLSKRLAGPAPGPSRAEQVVRLTST
jgi:hypothetical protein